MDTVGDMTNTENRLVQGDISTNGVLGAIRKWIGGLAKIVGK